MALGPIWVRRRSSPGRGTRGTLAHTLSVVLTQCPHRTDTACHGACSRDALKHGFGATAGLAGEPSAHTAQDSAVLTGLTPRAVGLAVVALAPNVGSAVKRSWQGAGGTVLGGALGLAVMAIVGAIVGTGNFTQHPVATVPPPLRPT